MAKEKQPSIGDKLRINNNITYKKKYHFIIKKVKLFRLTISFF